MGKVIPPKPELRRVKVTIGQYGDPFSMDADMNIGDAAKLMTYAMQLMTYRQEQSVQQVIGVDISDKVANRIIEREMETIE